MVLEWSRAETGVGATIAPVSQGVAGEEGRKVRRDADRPHAGPAASVGDTEGLVQVEVANVGPDVAR